MSDVGTEPATARSRFPLWNGAWWALAVPIAAWLRFEGDLSDARLLPIMQFTLLAVALHTVSGAALARYRGHHVIGAIDDALDVVAVIAAVGTTLFVIGLTGVLSVPRSLAVIAMFVVIPMILGMRLSRRLVRERRIRPDAASAQRVIVFGAGWGGQQIVRSMLGDGRSGYLPVAFLDDDPAARNRRMSGVPVLGTRNDIGHVARSTGADVLVVAIRDLDPTVIREVSRAAIHAGLRVKVIPALTDLLGARIGFTDLRDIDVADLMGRTPVEIDVAAIAGYLKDEVVLVTGAGGSIGSELCRQIHRYHPAELLMLDRDESALHALQLSLHGHALLNTPDTILADIRDATTITSIFRERQPDVVFHAAALKHLPMLEQYPYEAWLSNVVGTANVLDAAVAADVKTFVNISTDKAANPTSVLGASKRISERLVAHVGVRARGTYLSVRFGNVIGSRGSVLTTFAEQIAGGGPVTVTHPDITRFFMTIPEAVRLVVQAGAIGRPGEALVLDMGNPVKIVDVARQLMMLAGRPIQILYTGLRDGEKLHEELFGDGERDHRPIHPAVSHVAVPPLDPVHLTMSVHATTAAEAMHRLAAVVEDLDAQQDSVAAFFPIGARQIRSTQRPVVDRR